MGADSEFDDSVYSYCYHHAILAFPPHSSVVPPRHTALAHLLSSSFIFIIHREDHQRLVEVSMVPDQSALPPDKPPPYILPLWHLHLGTVESPWRSSARAAIPLKPDVVFGNPMEA